MEGYGIYESKDDQSALEQLESKFDNKVIKSNRRWMSIAASLIALLSITFVVKNQLDNETKLTSARESISTAINNKLESYEPIAEAIPQIDDFNATASATNKNIEEKIEQEISFALPEDNYDTNAIVEPSEPTKAKGDFTSNTEVSDVSSN